ncbi:proline racemase family protein [Rubrobacter naiadicus]|uniref:proline racemase family protein n=1 Tax=Rubrobacter naiadicus TaxID=1392641 RepID=UPI003B5B6015
MLLEKMVSVVDSHTEGMPTRVVTGGLPPVPGRNMFEKLRYVQSQLDHLRRMLVYEPRGHPVMVAALLVPPANPEADLGVLFADEMGYLPMCGHGTIGVCTVAVETGLVSAEGPTTCIVLDTPAGKVTAQVRMEKGRAKSVAFHNVPAFLAEQDAEVDVEGIGRLKMDIAYGGNFFAILPASSAGLSLTKENARGLVEVGMRIMAAVEEQVHVEHPSNPEIREVKHVIFTGEADAAGAHAKNATVIYPGMLDRSPCGTGTSARMAQLFARGGLSLGEDFVHESIIGTLFTGHLVGEKRLEGGISAVVPVIEGRAWIHGLQHIVVDPEDPFPTGFALGD